MRVGRQGEDRVVTEIERALDSRWCAFRNVVLPGNNADLDIVLVGPGGTWVLEVKAYSGSWRVEKGKWYKLTSNGYWARNSFGPGAQAIQNAKRLCNHLKANGMTSGVAVKPVVIVAQDTQIDLVSAGTRIWRLPDLPGRLAELSRGNYHDQWRVQEIAALLQPRTANGQLVH